MKLITVLTFLAPCAFLVASCGGSAVVHGDGNATGGNNHNEIGLHYQDGSRQQQTPGTPSATTKPEDPEPEE